jgi:DNA-binding response OmpR family regulator
LVDDSELALATARAALEEAGYEVLAAGDLAEFEHYRDGLDVDLVLLDVQMPEIFGDDIGAVLRHFDGVNTPIYLYSNLAPGELEVRAAEAGIDGYISKRDGIDAIVERIKQIFESRS